VEQLRIKTMILREFRDKVRKLYLWEFYDFDVSIKATE